MTAVNTSKKKAAVHQEFLWVLGRHHDEGHTEIVYRLCRSTSECYETAVAEKLLGPGWTGKGLALAGWKPVRALVTVDLQ